MAKIIVKDTSVTVIGFEKKYLGLCHYQRAYMFVEHGKLKCRVHQARYITRRKACKTQPDSHLSNGSAGERRRTQAVKIKHMTEL